MRFLHLSDLHFGKTLFSYSLLEDQRHWCGQLLSYLSSTPHDAVVIAGDLYDRQVPSGEAVELCDWFLSRLAADLGLPVLCISGNHDSPSRLGFASALYRAGGLHMAAVPQRDIHTVTLRDEHGPVHFHLIPYLSPATGKNLFPDGEVKSFDGAFSALMEHNRGRISWEERNVAVAHGFFAPFSKGGDESPAPDTDALRSDSEVSVGGLDLVNARHLAPFDYGALGHLHAPQTAGLPHLRYCGTPLKYSLSEEGQTKQVISVTLGQKGTVETEAVFFPPLRELRTVEGTLEEILAPTGGTFSSEDYMLVNILTDTTLLGVAEQIRNVFPNYLTIRYLSTVRQEVLLGENAKLARQSLEEAFSAFFLEVTGRPLSPEEEALVAQTAQDVRGGGEAS